MMTELIASLSAAFHSLISWIVEVVGALGYPGIITMMFLESSFFPFPSEVVIPPAGWLARTGQMDIIAVVACGIVGSVLGALFNYWLAIRWGRRIFDRYGKYFFIKPETLDKAEAFFAKHGHISTFTARLLPVIRQYVSLPAGLARMDLAKFCIYTAAGSGIWVVILAAVGYMLGADADPAVMKKITLGLIAFCAVVAGAYVIKNRMSKKDR